MSRGKSLTRYEVDAIKRLADLGMPTRDICALTGRSDSTIQEIRYGRREEKSAKRKAQYMEKKAQSAAGQVEIEDSAPYSDDSALFTILARCADTLDRILEQLETR